MAFAIYVTDETQLVEQNPQFHILLGPVMFFRTLINESYLIKNLVKRDVKSRYSRAFIGFGWTILEPLLLSIVYYCLFVIISGTPDKLYPLHVLTGVIIWGHFSKSLQASVVSLTKGKNLIKQVYFPREILAISPVVAQFWISCTSLLAVVPIMVYLGVEPEIQILWMLPLGLFLSTILALGIGMLVAPLNAIVQDVQHLFKFITRAGFFVSPVMWTYEMASTRSDGKYLDEVMLNPMVVPLTLVRKGLDGSDLVIGLNHIAYSIIFSVVALLIGITIFKKCESGVVKYL
jgi:ABC-2 type transport system permease protein|tara:strand:+ start:70 stop:939 length:870 start_codon:yes stop_codon:yes gene_type:complete